MNRNTVQICQVRGIPIRAHLLLLIFLPVITTYFSSPSFAVRVLGALGLFVSVALHELGHSIVAQAKGSYIQEIVLYPFGGAAKVSNIPRRPADEIQIAIAGPAVSLLLGLIGTGVGLWMINGNPDTGHYPIILELGAINLMLFFFNLLPAFPMDGGRVLRAVLSIRMSRIKATMVASTVGKYFCFLFVFAGLFILKSLILAFIGVYIYFVGQMEYRQVVLENQAERFSGFRDGQIDVEVSPPPYASKENPVRSIQDKLKEWFRR